MIFLRTWLVGVFALTLGAGADAAVVIKTGAFGAATNDYEAFTYGLGPGSYAFTLTFSTPVQDVQPDSTVEKITTTNYYCDFADGQGEVYCGGDDVPTMPIFDQITSTTYRIYLTVNPPYDEPPPSPPPYMRYDEFDTCCNITLDFDTRDAGAYILSYTAIPEPAAWALFSSGMLGIGGLLRRRRYAAT